MIPTAPASRHTEPVALAFRFGTHLTQTLLPSHPLPPFAPLSPRNTSSLPPTGIRERASKRSCLEEEGNAESYPYAPPPHPIPLDKLPSTCIALVFEFLPSCRDVYNLAFQSMYLRGHVERRMDIVVRAAVHERGRGKNGTRKLMSWQNKETRASGSMKQVCSLLQDRSVYVPGPLQLLRRLCATRCEMGTGCWGYDMIAGRSRPLGVWLTLPFSLALCDMCHENHTNSYTVGHSVYSFAMSQARIARSAGGGNCTICTNSFFESQDGGSYALTGDVARPLTEASVGPTPTGPIINGLEVYQLARMTPPNLERAFECLVDEVYGAEGSTRRNAYEASADAVVAEYNRSVEALHAYKRAETERYNAKVRRQKEKKRQLTEPIVMAVEDAVEGATNDYLVLKYTWIGVELEFGRAVRFHAPFVNYALSEESLLNCPSAATKKRISRACDKIRRMYDIIGSAEAFTSFSFLEKSRNRIKQKMLQYCRANLAGFEQLFGCSDAFHYTVEGIDDTFFELLEKKYYLTALLRILHLRGTLSDVAATIIVPDGDSSNRDLKLKLARRVYLKLTTEAGLADTRVYRIRLSPEKYTTDYGWSEPICALEEFLNVKTSICGDARTEYARMHKHSLEFQRLASVREWVRDDDSPDEPDNRQHAIDVMAWNPSHTIHLNFVDWVGRSPYTMLRRRNYDRLLDFAKLYNGSTRIFRARLALDR